MNLELYINKKQFHLLLSPYLNDGVVFLVFSFFVLLIVSKDRGNILIEKAKY